LNVDGLVDLIEALDPFAGLAFFKGIYLNGGKETSKWLTK